MLVNYPLPTNLPAIPPNSRASRQMATNVKGFEINKIGIERRILKLARLPVPLLEAQKVILARKRFAAVNMGPHKLALIRSKTLRHGPKRNFVRRRM